MGCLLCARHLWCFWVEYGAIHCEGRAQWTEVGPPRPSSKGVELPGREGPMTGCAIPWMMDRTQPRVSPCPVPSLSLRILQ